MSTQPRTNKEIVRDFFEIYNHQDYQKAYACMALDYYDHSLSQVRCLEDAIAILKSTHRSFPDLKVTVDELIEENDRVVFRGHFAGTHRGEFLGIKPTDTNVSFEALEIFKIKDQKITESWGYWPINEILDQITASTPHS